MPSILDEIVATTRRTIARSRAARPEETLLRAIGDPAAPTRDFPGALSAEGVRLIAEVKKASPSAGLIRADFDPIAIGQTYERHGAACLSVLTDEPYFQGRLEYLRDVRAAVGVPCLRKDFILDRYQLLEARAAGADAVLLIAECLTPAALASLHGQAVELGLAPLVELYDPANLPAVLDAGARLIGVNNRDLRTFEVDLEHTIRLRDAVPDHCLLVAESGIRTHADIRRLGAAGVDAVLVGESLMRRPDIGAAVDALMRG